MFKMSISENENTKEYLDYEIPLEILHAILKAGTNIKVHKKYSSIKNKLCMTHVCGSINSLSNSYQNIAYDIIFGYWKLPLSYHVQRNEILKKFEDVRYKNINKLIKAIKYHDKRSYNKYIKPIIRNINRPPQVKFIIQNLDVNISSDPSVVINLNALDKTSTIEKILSELSGSFRIIKNTNVVITENDGFIRFAPYSEIYKMLCLIKERFKHQYKSIKDAFEKHKDKFIVSNVRFINFDKNTNDVLYTFNGYKYQDDKYTPRNYLAIKKCTAGCKAFFSIIKKMFYNIHECEYFIKYLAWVIQNPGSRSEIIPVLCSNINTSYFIEMLIYILGYYALSVSTSIYDKIKQGKISDLMGLILVVIDDDLNNSEDITNTGRYTGGIIGASDGTNITTNCCNYSDVTGYGIIEYQSYGYDCRAVNCFWLNDIAGNKGVEIGFDMEATERFDAFENNGYFTRSSSSCTLIQLGGKDLVDELNRWVNENDPSTYRRWKYETVNGYACPVLE